LCFFLCFFFCFFLFLDKTHNSYLKTKVRIIVVGLWPTTMIITKWTCVLIFIQGTLSGALRPCFCAAALASCLSCLSCLSFLSFLCKATSLYSYKNKNKGCKATSLYSDICFAFLTFVVRTKANAIVQIIILTFVLRILRAK